MMNVVSVSVMGKAGILMGGKGDIMLPDSHIFEGSADNYPFDNDFLGETSNKIINEVKGINRVTYDITSKPPGTIEWE